MCPLPRLPTLPGPTAVSRATARKMGGAHLISTYFGGCLPPAHRRTTAGDTLCQYLQAAARRAGTYRFNNATSLRNPGAPSSASALTPQARTSSVCTTSLGPLIYDSSVIPLLAVPTATVQAQVPANPTTTTLPISSLSLFQHNSFNHYNATIRQLIHVFAQLQLTNPTMA